MSIHLMELKTQNKGVRRRRRRRRRSRGEGEKYADGGEAEDFSGFKNIHPAERQQQ